MSQDEFFSWLSPNYSAAEKQAGAFEQVADAANHESEDFTRRTGRIAFVIGPSEFYAGG